MPWRSVLITLAFVSVGTPHHSLAATDVIGGAPTDADIKAVYCFENADRLIDGAQKSGLGTVLAADSRSNDPKVREAASHIRDGINRVGRDRERLTNYLSDRIASVDNGSLSFAKKQADDDYDLMSATEGDPIAIKEATARAKSCRDLSWLPDQ